MDEPELLLDELPEELRACAGRVRELVVWSSTIEELPEWLEGR